MTIPPLTPTPTPATPTPPAPTPPAPTPPTSPLQEARCGDVIQAGERRFLNENLICNITVNSTAITVFDGGELDCQGNEITVLPGTSNAASIGIEMTGLGRSSKVSNCNVRGEYVTCISAEKATDETPHMIVNSNVSYCTDGFLVTGGVSISSSSVRYHTRYGVQISGQGRSKLENVEAVSNGDTNVYILSGARVNMTNVNACFGGSYDIYNRGDVQYSSLACAQGEVSSLTDITCEPCPF
jgi:hypothetical protein